ncbi:MAG: hypothetical protein J6I84_04795 [Bacilli bacterium]|nr:hypothetical protein [Bacilli bacterium]
MATYKLKRKTFGIPGALFGAKNFKAMASGMKGTEALSAGKRALEGAKGLAKSVGTVGAVGAVGAGALANKAGASEVLSGGENTAQKMEFS